MYHLLLVIALLHCAASQNYQQKVAPGVPPQAYQNYQPPPPQGVPQQPPQYQQQQYQQPPQQQYQQVPVQQQQVPVQQQQVPVQQQQVPQSHGGGHGHDHHGDPQILNAANIAEEREHIQEHMQVPIDTSKMSEQELQFHYFKMHDNDQNNKLDGCELIKSLIHWHEQGGKKGPDDQGDKVFTDEELTNLIDPILNIDDQNKDGFIDYPEFVRAQQKNMRQEQEGQH